MTLIQGVGTAAADAETVGVGVRQHFLNGVQAKQVKCLHGPVGEGRNAQRPQLRWVAAFRNVDTSQRLRLIAAATQFAEGKRLQHRSIPYFVVDSGSGRTLVGGHSQDGHGPASQRVGEQINQCVDLVPSARLRSLHDTRLEPTGRAVNLPPVDGVPAHGKAGGRTSGGLPRRQICIAP